MENYIKTSDYDKLTKDQMIEYIMTLERLVRAATDEPIVFWLTSERSEILFTHEYRCLTLDMHGQKIHLKTKLDRIDNQRH